MPLPLPQLDVRDFDQLVDEARNMLPLNAPAWTDHNASDPGITLLELFAYLTDIGQYPLDRITPAEYRTFLRLLGYPIRAAQVARTVVTFSQAAAEEIAVAARTQIASADGSIVFQAMASVDVVRAALVSVLTAPASGDVTDRSAANGSLGAPFAALGDQPATGAALYLGFDRTLGAEGTLVRLYAFGQDAASDAKTWRALAAEARKARQDVRATCPGTQLRRIGRYWLHYSARLAWEYYDVSGQWLPLANAKDRTRALSISGPVHFRSPKPASHAPGGVAGHDATYFIRCRLTSGGYDCAPLVRGIRINAVNAVHAVDMPPEGITTYVRRASQSYQLAHAPVVPRSSSVDIVLSDGVTHESWTEVLDWDRSGPFDRDYVVDSTTGTLRFGDGRVGRVLQDRSAIASMTVNYRVGGGPTGNVPAGTIVTMRSAGVNPAIAVSQPIDAHGGAAADTLSDAEGRAVRSLAAARCAVTLADFERLALQVPGAPVARTHAIANFDPSLQCLPAAGCITIVIVPPCVDRQRDPTAALCAAVTDYLDRRRPLTCELHVTGPQYTTVSVSATLNLTRTSDASVAIAAAQAALGAFFDPLTGGAAGTGWPIGRGVYRSEVLALLAAIPGVAYVTDLEFTAGCGPGAACGNVDVCAHGLVISGSHDITATTAQT